MHWDTDHISVPSLSKKLQMNFSMSDFELISTIVATLASSYLDIHRGLDSFSFVKFFEKTFVLFEDLLVSRQPVFGPVDGAVVLAVHVLKHRVLERGGTSVGLCLLWFRGEQEDLITCLLN